MSSEKHYPLYQTALIKYIISTKNLFLFVLPALLLFYLLVAYAFKADKDNGPYIAFAICLVMNIVGVVCGGMAAEQKTWITGKWTKPTNPKLKPEVMRGEYELFHNGWASLAFVIWVPVSIWLGFLIYG